TRSVFSGAEIAIELDSDGTRYTYLWGPGRLPLSVTRVRSGQPTETFAYQVDAMGSVIGMTDAEGTVVATYSYDPWGKVTSVSGSDAALAARNPLRYRAYYQDTETGLYYMPARYYDPATYRFLRVDPAPPSAGDPGSLNAFVYCGNDPIGATDPSGARADLDGDGKVSAEEHKILNLRDKKAAEARSKAAGSEAARRARGAADARAAAMDTYYAALFGFGVLSDGTPFGRENLNFGVSAPGEVEWGLAIAGTVLDVVGVCCLPVPGLAIGLWVVGAVVDGCAVVYYYYPEWKEGRKTVGDIIVAACGTVPGIGSEGQLGLYIGDSFARWTIGQGIPWAE
ncbi:MAG: RHS repeat-associated core domain-containing protein, partial [Actinomycetota bacterium]|nr:RHS repeat-associated core domain-containing protein [Actinomycetota bacterium]